MKICLKAILLCLIVIAQCPVALADVVELKNGSTIIGAIQKMDQNSILLNTDFAGSLTIKLDSVKTFTTDKPVFVAFPDQSRVFGKISYREVQTKVETPEGDIFSRQTLPVNAWIEGMPDPQGRHWRYELGLDVAGKTGNAEKFSTGGRAQAVIQGPDDRLLLYMRYAYAKDEGVESDNAIVGGIDFEYYFKNNHSSYARIELEKDEIKNIDFHATAAAGYGYFFLKKTNHVLRGRTGLMYRHESPENEPSDAVVGLDVGLSHMYRFANAWRLNNEVTYTPSLEDISNYRIYHESAFEIPLVTSEVWMLRLGVSNDYNSQPADDKKYLDTSYFARMIFTWK